MIEKLSEYKITSQDGAFINVECNTKIINTLVRKINELCDIINTIQKEREAEWFEIKEWIGILEAVRKSVNVHEKQIDELQMKPELEKTSEESAPEIPDSAYVTINDMDAYISSEPVTEYNGEKIYDLYYLPAYFKEARDIIREEYGVKLLEIHALQSSTSGEYAKQGTPIPDKNGTCCWCRCVCLDEENNAYFTPWVFYYADGSASYCSYYCASYCSYYVRGYSGFRAALFAGLKCSKKD